MPDLLVTIVTNVVDWNQIPDCLSMFTSKESASNRRSTLYVSTVPISILGALAARSSLFDSFLPSIIYQTVNVSSILLCFLRVDRKSANVVFPLLS